MGSKVIQLSRSAGAGFTARALHLVDLENLVGGPSVGEERVRQVWAAYAGGIPRTARDQVMVGSSGLFASRTWFLLPPWVQKRARDGQDGGELAILEEVDIRWVAERFGRLVIASGDHAFVDVALQARALGMHVHLVTGAGGVSRALDASVTTRSRLRMDLTLAA